MQSKVSGLLIRYRLICGFTQQMIADKLHIDRSTYSYYESGKVTPGLKKILVLRRILNIPYKELINCFNEETDQLIEGLSKASKRKPKNKF